jgi:hypothetical protein
MGTCNYCYQCCRKSKQQGKELSSVALMGRDENNNRPRVSAHKLYILVFKGRQARSSKKDKSLPKAWVLKQGNLQRMHQLHVCTYLSIQ